MSQAQDRGPVRTHRWSFLIRLSCLWTLVLTLGLVAPSVSATPLIVPNFDDGGSGSGASSAITAIDPKDVGNGYSFVDHDGPVAESRSSSEGVSSDQGGDTSPVLPPFCLECEETPY